MGQVLAALALGVIGLALLLIIAPLLLVGALGVLALAWRRPATVSRLTEHPRLSRVPVGVRSTPIRFATSVLVVAIALTATSRVIAGPPSDDADGLAGASADAVATVSATASPTPPPRATSRQTAEPTPRPTPKATPRPTPAPGEEPTGPTEVGTVVNIVDGDTVDVVVGGVEMRVRYIGMDTPEVHSGVEWLGPEASAANAALVLGKDVVLEKDVSETDQFGRALRYVWIQEGSAWTLVNLELIRLGLAQITTYPPDVKYVDDLYVGAQDEARRSGLGLWGTPPTPVPTVAPTPAPPVATPLPAAPAPPSNCHSSYTGACLAIGAGDYDCAGGSGNGPNYIQGPIYVVGWDEFDLDRDGDGVACER